MQSRNFGKVVGCVFLVAANAIGSTPLTKQAEQVIAQHVKEVVPLEKQVGLAWWDANISGKEEDFAKKEKVENELDNKMADPNFFAELRAVYEGLKKSPKSVPVLVKRQIDVLYLDYLEKQVDKELLKKITAKSNAIEKSFNVYRAKVGDAELSDSQVKNILKSSKNSAERKQVWEASKAVGAVVEKDLRELVSLRNEAAMKLGFSNYHEMQLALSEQVQKDVLKLFDELDNLTREPFLKMKRDMDERLAASYGIQVDELRPWHYHDPFFQEAPSVFATDLDGPYKKADIKKLSRDFYKSIGLPVDDVLARSDLYEKKGKSPHAFCTDIDREGDVRVLANIVPNEYWMGTMLHELGHSVYSSKNIPLSVPYVLRTQSHILTTEGVAMLFEQFAKRAGWLKAMGVQVSDPASFAEVGSKLTRNELLIFSRWCQVMFRFEVELYKNPNQDLNALWWGLVERYQGLKKPVGRSAPDYASKIHIVTSPAYYHNYMMGQLFASQVFHKIAKDVLKEKDRTKITFVGKKSVGIYFKKKIFDKGNILPWNELTKFATGAPLNATAFAEDIK